jgi:hypothetical protein
MRKSYRSFIACGLLLAATTVWAQDPLYTLKNFSSATVLQAAEAPYGISVTAINAEINTLSASLPCLDINGNTQGLKLLKTGTTAYGDIDIAVANPEVCVIEKVEVIGSSSGVNEANAVMAVSLDGTSFPVGTSALYYTSSGQDQSMARIVSFGTDPGLACSSGIVTYLIPETAYVGTAGNTNRPPLPDFREKVKLIRLRWGASFAGKNPANTTWAPYIYGIKVYVKSTSTGITGETAGKTALSTSFINLTGKAVEATAKGLLIKRTVYDDGSVKYGKVYIK